MKVGRRATEKSEGREEAAGRLRKKRGRMERITSNNGTISIVMVR